MYSRTTKIVQIGCASVWCLFSSGIIFGFAAFKAILIGEGVYGEYCLDDDSAGPCTEQDLELNFIFALAAGVTNMAALPVGWVLDYYGPRISGIIGSFWIALGAVMYIWAQEFSRILDPYLMGYSMFAIGGPFVFISSFQLANTFPNKSGFILSLITGTFDCSSVVFLFYRLCYKSSSKNWHLSQFFGIYITIPLFILVSQLTVMPYDSYKTQGTIKKRYREDLGENSRLPEGVTPTEASLYDGEQRNLLNGETWDCNTEVSASRPRSKPGFEAYAKRKLKRNTCAISGMLYGKPIMEQICSPMFYLMLVFTMICMLRINYYVATIRSQEIYLLKDRELALRINSKFDVLLPLGVVAIPFTGLILNNVEIFKIMITVFTSSMLVGILGLIPNSFNLHLIHIVILVVYRPFLYTVVSDYISKIFGLNTFGTIYGILISVSGIFTTTQSILDRVTHTTFGMNPTPINSILVLVTALSGVALLWNICLQRNKAQMIG